MSPGVPATTARALFTRPRRSRKWRSAARSSSSRKSSGKPLVVSITLNRRVEVATSSSSSSDGNATLASTRVRDLSCGRCAASRVGTVIGTVTGRVGGAGFGAAGPQSYPVQHRSVRT